MQYAQVISAQVERMTKIMRGLLDFARRTPAEEAPTDLRELTTRIVDLLTTAREEAGGAARARR